MIKLLADMVELANTPVKDGIHHGLLNETWNEHCNELYKLLKGVEVKTIEEETCKGCEFENEPRVEECVTCSSIAREDGKNVIYVSED